MWSDKEIAEIIEKSAESRKKRESRKKALESVKIPANFLKIGGKARKSARVGRATYNSHVFREYGGILPNLPARNPQESTISTLHYRRTPDAKLRSSAIPRIENVEISPQPVRIRIKMHQKREKVDF